MYTVACAYAGIDAHPQPTVLLPVIAVLLVPVHFSVTRHEGRVKVRARLQPIFNCSCCTVTVTPLIVIK